MDYFESNIMKRMTDRFEKLGLIMESFLKKFFDQYLIKNGFNLNLINGLISRFKNINPRILKKLMKY